MKKTAIAIPALLAALALAACGSGGGGETTSASSAAEATAPKSAGASQDASSQGQDQGDQGQGDQGQSDQGQNGDQGQGDGAKQGGDSKAVPGDTSAGFTPPAHSDSGGGTKPFETKGGDNSIQEFGSEASGGDFEAAATALHGYLDARAAHAWTAACSYMSPGVAASLAQLSGSGGGSGGGASCPQTLASLSAAVSAAALDEAAVADVAALRTEGARAFLLFHGAHGTAYFMPMASEDGTWKVAAIAPSAIP